MSAEIIELPVMLARNPTWPRQPDQVKDHVIILPVVRVVRYDDGTQQRKPKR